MAGHPRSSPTPSPLASRNPGGRGQGYHHRARPSPPGAFPAGGVAVRPPYPGARPGAAAGLAGRTVLQVLRGPAVPASVPCPALPCPSSHLQAQVTDGRDWGAEPRLTQDAAPHPSPGTAGLSEPRAPHACRARVGRGCGGLCACAARRPAPRPVLRRVSARPSPPAASPGVAPGRSGGRARGAGRPPGSDGTWCSGSERAPPASRLLAGQRAPEPAS